MTSSPNFINNNIHTANIFNLVYFDPADTSWHPLVVTTKDKCGRISSKRFDFWDILIDHLQFENKAPNNTSLLTKELKSDFKVCNAW
jgi:hypothetical protein